jgi:hypothetical protein
MTDDVNSPNKWEADYERGTDGWDLKGPTPTFKQLAASGRFKPGRMIVLGAGRGHDAREFARHSFEVTAVDFSPHAVREMQRLATPEAPVDILQSDIFTLPAAFDHSFDYVLEYTCFCAIDPRRRGEYADLVARLLRSPDALSGRSPDALSGRSPDALSGRSPDALSGRSPNALSGRSPDAGPGKNGGIYIDLAFPLDGHKGGPPFAVSLPEILALFNKRGFTLLERRTPSDSVQQRRGLEELLIFAGPSF